FGIVETDDGGVRARSIDPHQGTALALELADELLVAQVLHRDTSAGNQSTEAGPRERARPTVGSTRPEDRGDQLPVCETEEDQRPDLTGDRLGVEADRIGAVERVLEQLPDATEEEPGDHLSVACPAQPKPAAAWMSRVRRATTWSSMRAGASSTSP